MDVIMTNLPNSPSFFQELEELDAKGLPNVYDRILVSDRVHIDFDLHAAVDGLEEVELGGGLLDMELVTYSR